MLHQVKNLFSNRYSEIPEPLPGFQTYLSFMNGLWSDNRFLAVVNSGSHESEDLLGWKGLESFTCLTQSNELYDIDIRYAWSQIIFQQNLIDHGWTETTLMRNQTTDKNRHKIIIYLCASGIQLLENKKIEKTPQQFVLGNYWQTIYHLYLLLPIEHPFVLPKLNLEMMADITNLQPPSFENNPIIDKGSLRSERVSQKCLEEKPLVSIITVVKNGEKYLEQTIQSVINQTYSNIEYVIIDGCSTDGTLDIIKKYDDKIDYWVSEPDGGISDAFNKGVNLCSGDIIGILSSDDLYFQTSTLNTIVNEFARDLQTFCFGKCFYVSNKIISSIDADINYVKKINFYMPHINHPTVFMKKKILDKFLFSTQYKYCMDYHLFIRLTKKKIIGRPLNQAIAIVRTDGVSNFFYYQTRKEVFKAATELGTNKVLAFLIYFILITKYWIKQCIKF
ncbi:glycosyltransferase family 2 protein [Calothrix sp. NIES-2100]|uniref:glycosyltransferase family 2 protein n=1 Tax=Calothrix sp. NIES-2100 TaxID=1954172 RepID=UPI0030DA927C